MNGDRPPAPPSGPEPPDGPRGTRQGRRTLILTAILLVLAGVWAYQRQQRSGAALQAPPSGQAIIVDAEEPLAEPGRSAERQVVVFFSREGTEGLVPEKRRIYVTASIPDQARQVIEELIRGPRRTLNVPVLPRETTLRQVYLDGEGHAYVDFGADLISRHPGGSQAESATLFAVVNSLAYNFPEIKSVQILIEGEERETLAGHLDLGRRYYRDLSRVDPSALESLQAGEEPIASR